MWFILGVLVSYLFVFLLGVVLGDHYCLMHSALSKLESLIQKIKLNSKHSTEAPADDDA